MTSKPTTFSEAGLSIAFVRPGAGESRNNAPSVQRYYGFRHRLSLAKGNEPYRVTRDQQLELISVLPYSGTRRGTRVAMAMPRFKPCWRSTALLNASFCPGHAVRRCCDTAQMELPWVIYWPYPRNVRHSHSLRHYHCGTV